VDSKLPMSISWVMRGERVIEAIEKIPSWELLRKAAEIAETFGWHLYLVGGVVRDLLLAQAEGENLSITDIDLVVDCCEHVADVAAGVKLATLLQQHYPAAHLDIHGAFQTAALTWHQDPLFGALGVDIATARTESYLYPAANPEVSASSIRQDLYRRDFTINALAWRLTSSSEPPLLDLFGGLLDLQARQIRVLHADSFIDDPTRIYRGARFAVRLGFEFEPQTAAYIREAISSGVYVQTARSHQRTPALQSRLKTELKYLFQVSYWQPTLQLLANLDALQCVHPTLKLDPNLLHQFRLLNRCLNKFDRAQKIVHWQLQLDLMIASLAPEYRQPVAKNLQLPTDQIDRLENLDRAESQLKSLLPSCGRISEVVRLLKQFDRETLILGAIRCQDTRSIYRQIWKYLTVWSNIQPILNGNDLCKLGYQPGKQYRQILDDLLVATLDGEISDRLTAESFLTGRYQ
jgi:tRNA nucleotidyltransferase (CCA-adding enzyme)